ncbi:hypothetical protein ACFFLZ_21645 [Photobacterium aphoticum]|uniref:DUF3316 domain-containing protein n=1 Tax=Photobacterium aphoticum TaxID=754436 RepID=A0A0J1GIC5_9GAMM|nr:hypothetical protein [Photobacterium aphoticum]KLU99449.1 hypothetical protein ABT58_17605 [Photobacterium aphoticum]PSU55956.1 hypothetical protein C9I90_14605 [Photobacterium aphoticum]GHA38084.1 hypothetical protein GCM10007086_09450 [Photobacterium aphoticum]
MKQLGMFILSVGLGAAISAGTAVAGDDVVVDSDVTKVESELAKKVKAQKITVEQAKEMGLNRAETYEVTSTVSVDNLELQLAEKLKDSIMPYYSIEYNDPTSDDEAYRAMVTEYFGKVE